MTSTITGVNEIIRNLESKLGPAKTNRVVNKALRNARQQVYDDVKSATATYMDTGATNAEVVKSGVKGASKGIKTIEVGFNGPKGRWRLVHLNEFGYTRYGRNYHPRGFGKLQEVVDKTETSILPKMQSDLEELTK